MQTFYSIDSIETMAITVSYVLEMLIKVGATIK